MFFHSALSLILLASSGAVVDACPFAAGGGDRGALPDGHPDTKANDKGGIEPCPTPPRRLRMASLKEDPATRERLRGVVSRRVSLRERADGDRRSEARRGEPTTGGGRSLQAGACFTRATYDDIREDVLSIAQSITDVVDRGHFLGGIVRLAAHDFMDYDPRPDHNDGHVLGMDGCYDTGASDNNGLETIWCDDDVLCPLKAVYDAVYAVNGVGRADFWVAAANAVVKLTSRGWTDSGGTIHADLDLPFRYGRVDNDNCAPPLVDSAHRLPGAQHCSEVQRTFIDQMNLTWTDAVALLGAHTLGFGNSAFSGHHGMWMDEVNETITFDKRYYEEILRRAWRPRNRGDPNEDWTWAGSNGGNPRMMLNADICLAFDIDDSPDCCSRIREGDLGEVFCLPPGTDPDTVNVTQCNSSAAVRPEARQAVDAFAVSTRNSQSGENGDNRPFYEAYASAWEKATEAGYAEGTLHALADTCAPTEPPTVAPTSGPTSDPTSSPTSNPTSNPTRGPTDSPTPAPTPQPTNPPTPVCSDTEPFMNDKGNMKDCQWAVDNGKCGKYGVQFCPVKCAMCGCKARGDGCGHSSECCSGFCGGSGTCKAPPEETA